jgi:hypothetical protein
MDFVCNILLDTDLSLRIFKRSSTEFLKINFDRFHFCIRGRKAAEAFDFINGQILKQEIYIYEEYDLNNWLFVMKGILSNISGDKFYLYFEDHFLQMSLEEFSSLISEARVADFDVMNTSFYQATKFQQPELALFKIAEFTTFETYQISTNEIKFLIKDAGDRFIVGLNSIFSTGFFNQYIMKQNNYKSMYSQIIPKIMWKIAPKSYRNIYRFINKYILNRIKLHLYWFNPASPFNYEYTLKDLIDSNFTFAIPGREVCANIDDDNGALCSCLWKRGEHLDLLPPCYNKKSVYEREAPLKVNGVLKLKYTPRKGRVSNALHLRITLLEGDIKINGQKLNTSEPLNLNVFKPDGITASGHGTLKISLIE